MMDENDRSHEDCVLCGTSAARKALRILRPWRWTARRFFRAAAGTVPARRPAPRKKPPRFFCPASARPIRPWMELPAAPSKWGKILLILQGILSILASLVQLWRTQMLPVLYLVILAALLALLWLLVKRCQEYNVPGKVARVFSVFLCACHGAGLLLGPAGP